MSDFVRFFVVNSLLGVLVGWLFAAAILLTDTGGLGALYISSNEKLLVLAVIFGSSGINFGFLYPATAALLRTEETDKT